MLGMTEIVLLLAAVVLLAFGLQKRFRPYRRLFGGACVLMLISALFPASGNPFGAFLFGEKPGGLHPPRELFGIAWWILGAWLLKSLLDLILTRTIFPNNGEPHARRLFADLAAALIYLLAFVGILDTAFKQQISALLATSGVLAIVIGFALQSTLGDVLSGLAINIERPFGAGDWISIAGQASGQVIEINWRATRVRTVSNDTVMIPNSVASKAIVTNHSHPGGHHDCIVRLTADLSVPPSRVLAALATAAGGASQAFVCDFADSLVTYELAFPVDTFAETRGARSAMLIRIAETFRAQSIPIGSLPLQVRVARSPAPESGCAPQQERPNVGGPCLDSGLTGVPV
jgi:small-conductance mechanosensitive channel